MHYEEYVRITQEVSHAVDAKEYETALRLLNGLMMSDLPDLDKSYMAINLAVVWDKRENSLEALRWYDRAIRLEKPYDRSFAHLEKAAYLIRLDRKPEALAIYRDLLTKPFLTLNEQEKLRAYCRSAE